MTESDWLTETDWRPLLESLNGRITYRKGTLYICAGLREIWHLLYSDFSRRAVETGELAADGRATKDEIDTAGYWAESPSFGYDFESEHILTYMKDGKYSQGVRRLMQMGVFAETDIGEVQMLGNPSVVFPLHNAAHIAYHLFYRIVDGKFNDHLIHHLTLQAEWPGGWLLRETFGNPFRSLEITPASLDWKGGTVPEIARHIYDDRAYEHMPVLADALEESGCRDAAILDHCRHVRGCWVIDGILGLE